MSKAKSHLKVVPGADKLDLEEIVTKRSKQVAGLITVMRIASEALGVDTDALSHALWAAEELADEMVAAMADYVELKDESAAA